nr:S8 family serine peptidase [Fodinicola feengrottensis]
MTVSAVTKQDQYATFSSLGPRLGDYAVKPDISAPGVDIVAARAPPAAISATQSEIRTSGCLARRWRRRTWPARRRFWCKSIRIGRPTSSRPH